jgi:hypothetical protein
MTQLKLYYIYLEDTSNMIIFAISKQNIYGKRNSGR